MFKGIIFSRMIYLPMHRFLWLNIQMLMLFSPKKNAQKIRFPIWTIWWSMPHAPKIPLWNFVAIICFATKSTIYAVHIGGSLHKLSNTGMHNHMGKRPWLVFSACIISCVMWAHAFIWWNKLKSSTKYILKYHNLFFCNSSMVFTTWKCKPKNLKTSKSNFEGC